LGIKYKLIEQQAITIPRNSCKLGSKPKNATAKTSVRSIALEVAYTF